MNLLNSFKDKFNLNHTDLSRVDHLDAMVDLVYKVTKSDGNQFILKIFSRNEDYLRERYFLEFFSDKILVPKIIQTWHPDDHLSGAILMSHLSLDSQSSEIPEIRLIRICTKVI